MTSAHLLAHIRGHSHRRKLTQSIGMVAGLLDAAGHLIMEGAGAVVADAGPVELMAVGDFCGSR